MLKRTVIYSNIHSVKDLSNKIHELFLLDAEFQKKKRTKLRRALLLEYTWNLSFPTVFSERHRVCRNRYIKIIELIQPGSERTDCGGQGGRVGRWD